MENKKINLYNIRYKNSMQPIDWAYYTKFYPEKVKAFVQASQKGWEWAHEHPEEALDIVMKWAEKEQVHTNRIFQRWMLEEILRLQCEKGMQKPSFRLDEGVVTKLSDLLLKHHHIQNPITIEKLKGGGQ